MKKADSTLSMLSAKDLKRRRPAEGDGPGGAADGDGGAPSAFSLVVAVVWNPCRGEAATCGNVLRVLVLECLHFLMAAIPCRSLDVPAAIAAITSVTASVFSVVSAASTAIASTAVICVA